MSLPKANPDDRRYHGTRWRATSKRVLRRDGYTCWAREQQVDGSLIPCPAPARVADHIRPVYPGMPDFEFYSMGNLRASCQRHNTARGIAARLARETDSTLPLSPMHRGNGLGRLSRATPFFREGAAQRPPLAKSLSLVASSTKRGGK